jgi:hypothetical protein
MPAVDPLITARFPDKSIFILSIRFQRCRHDEPRFATGRRPDQAPRRLQPPVPFKLIRSEFG